MLTRIYPILLLGLALALPTHGQKAPSPLSPIAETPGLPNILLIGDSISIGYTLPTRALLQGEANVHRPPTNCGPTTLGLQSIDQWLGDRKWDVIHFNWGLHDLKYCDEKGTLVPVSEGHQQVPPETYAQNLETLVQRLRKTGATLIWRNTTPVPEGAAGRIPGDEILYNQAALKIMNDHHIPVHDMYSFVQPKMKEIMLPANVHFTPEGYKSLAETVAQQIRNALKTHENTAAE